ncbi:hypothetical protein Fot_13934 [Forsythia ovata]|uniref:Uncharacterized protein n=1 Tax=Forsythia ovata TaxID=205694 RepID=A0ABD1W5B6_9LAMI
MASRDLKIEMKMLKKVELKMVPTKLNYLLDARGKNSTKVEFFQVPSQSALNHHCLRLEAMKSKSGCKEDKTVGGALDLGCETTRGMLSGLPEKQAKRFTLL